MADDQAMAGTAAPVDVLRRWEDFGGSWRVIAVGSSALVISLCRCDGGEEIERLASADPDLIAFVGTRTSSTG